MGLFGLCFFITVHHWEKPGQELQQDRKLEVDADAEAMEPYCLLACFHGSLSLIPYRAQDHQHSDDLILIRLDPPT